MQINKQILMLDVLKTLDKVCSYHMNNHAEKLIHFGVTARLEK